MDHTRRRASATAAALAGAALCAAACAGPSHVQHVPDAASYHDQAVAFAKCMRTHGDPSFPDPGPGGAFPNDNGSLRRGSPQFKKAQAACEKLEPQGAPPQQALEDGFRRDLKFSACMRAHGIAKFPDPVKDAHGEGITVRGIDPNTPRYKSAIAACKHFQAGGGA
jgi:hypothetical protein